MKDGYYSQYPIVAKEHRKDLYKKKAAAAGVGVAAGAGIYAADKAIKKAGGYKAVGKKSYDTAKDAAGKSVAAAKTGGREALDGFTDSAGISAGKVGRKLRSGAQIAADKASPGMLRKAGSGLGKAFKKTKKFVGMSSKETRRLINLEAKLDRALDL